MATCFFVGNIASCPEVHCDEDQAKECSDALREFAKYHKVPINDKLMSEIRLGVVAAGFIGPRAFALGKKFWPKPQPRQPGPVLEMTRREAQPEAPGARQAQAPPPPGPPGREMAPSALDPLNAAGDLEEN